MRLRHTLLTTLAVLSLLVMAAAPADAAKHRRALKLAASGIVLSDDAGTHMLLDVRPLEGSFFRKRNGYRAGAASLDVTEDGTQAAGTIFFPGGLAQVDLKLATGAPDAMGVSPVLGAGPINVGGYFPAKVTVVGTRAADGRLALTISARLKKVPLAGSGRGH